MEFPFDVNEVLQNTITVLRGGQKAKGVKRDPHEFELEKIVNDMGVASAKVTIVTWTRIDSLTVTVIESSNNYI